MVVIGWYEAVSLNIREQPLTSRLLFSAAILIHFSASCVSSGAIARSFVKAMSLISAQGISASTNDSPESARAVLGA